VQRFAGQGTYQLTATMLGGQPPVCGNGVREGTEQCDGNDDAACPGFCGAGCSCSPACSHTGLTLSHLRASRGLDARLYLDNTGGTYDGLDPRAGPLTLGSTTAPRPSTSPFLRTTRAGLDRTRHAARTSGGATGPSRVCGA